MNWLSVYWCEKYGCNGDEARGQIGAAVLLPKHIATRDERYLDGNVFWQDLSLIRAHGSCVRTPALSTAICSICNCTIYECVGSEAIVCQCGSLRSGVH